MVITSSESPTRGGELPLEDVIEPMRFNEPNEHEAWRKAMEEEYKSIIKNKTW